MPFIAPIIAAVAYLASIPIIGTLLNLAVAAAITIGISYLTKALQPKPTNVDSGVRQPTGVQTQVLFGSSVPRTAIFGQQATAGHLIYYNTFGANNRFIQLVYVLGDGRHDSLAKLYVNGTPVTVETTFYSDSLIGSGYPVTEFRGKSTTAGTQQGVAVITNSTSQPRMVLEFFGGDFGQTVDNDLVTFSNPGGRWSAESTLAGMCYVRISMDFDGDLFPQGIPTFLFEVKGLRCYDPRKDDDVGGSGSHRWGQQGTYEWSNNPAVCLFNYQRGIYVGDSLILGQGLKLEELDIAAYIAAANACDDVIDTLIAAGSVNVSNGGTGYAIGELINLADGTFNRPAQLRVDSLNVTKNSFGWYSVTGPIAKATVVDGGDYIAPVPSNPVSTVPAVVPDPYWVGHASTPGSFFDKPVNYISEPTSNGPQLTYGNHTFTIETGLEIKAGQTIELDYSALIYYYLIPDVQFHTATFNGSYGGQVISYDPATGTLVVNVTSGAGIILVYPGAGYEYQSVVGNASWTIFPASGSGATFNVNWGSDTARYTVGMIVADDVQHRDSITAFLTAMAGMMRESVGTYAPIAGVPQTVVANITDADLIVGQSQTYSSKRSRAELINAIYGVYSEPSQNWQQVAFSPRTSLADEAEDGERLAGNISLPMIYDKPKAARVAETTRRLSRMQATATITLPFKFCVLEPGDWINWVSDRFGFDKDWLILSTTVQPDHSVLLSLREIDACVYVWDPALDEAPADIESMNDICNRAPPPETCELWAPASLEKLDVSSVFDGFNLSINGSLFIGDDWYIGGNFISSGNARWHKIDTTNFTLGGVSYFNYTIGIGVPRGITFSLATDGSHIVGFAEYPDGGGIYSHQIYKLDVSNFSSAGLSRQTISPDEPDVFSGGKAVYYNGYFYLSDFGAVYRVDKNNMAAYTKIDYYSINTAYGDLGTIILDSANNRVIMFPSPGYGQWSQHMIAQSLSDFTTSGYTAIDLGSAIPDFILDTYYPGIGRGAISGNNLYVPYVNTSGYVSVALFALDTLTYQSSISLTLCYTNIGATTGTQFNRKQIITDIYADGTNVYALTCPASGGTAIIYKMNAALTTKQQYVLYDYYNELGGGVINDDLLYLGSWEFHNGKLYMVFLFPGGGFNQTLCRITL